METIFKLHNQTQDPNYIGQDRNARDIIDIASNLIENNILNRKLGRSSNWSRKANTILPNHQMECPSSSRSL